MRTLRVVAGAAAVLSLGVAAAQSQPLTVVEVNAPAVNCVFHPACTITVSDTVGFIPLPYLAAPRTAFLQSRTFGGAPGTPAAGKAGYMYRISLTQAGAAPIAWAAWCSISVRRSSFLTRPGNWPTYS